MGGKPIYSLQIARKTDDNSLSRHFSVYTDTVLRSVRLRRSIAEETYKLVEQAEEWIVAEVQRYVDCYASLSGPQRSEF